jgi:hypothetical protein
MTEQVDGGQRRIDRLLSGDVLTGLADTDADTLLRLRDDAVQEEADLSYVRRLLQGRIDLLRFEQEHRAAGRPEDTPGMPAAGDDEELVRALTRVLTSHADSSKDEPPLSASTPGTIDPRDVEPRRREAEAAVADARVSNLGALQDNDLAAAVERLRVLERQVSASRRRVQEVVDALAEEVARRVELGQLPADSLPA